MRVKQAVGTDQNLSGVWWLNTTERQAFVDDVMGYMENEVWGARPGYAKTRNICTNRDNMCTHYAMQGRCNISQIGHLGWST
eukprot:1815677-Ditylum_brightwellii.AAC.1